MTNEFKKVKNDGETRYVLETATGGATSAGAVATVPGALDKVKKRGSILAQEAGKEKDAPKPRNFVAKNAKMGGAGAHKDKKKEQKQGKTKHKKPFAEKVEVLKSKLDTLKEAFGRYGSRNPDLMSPGDYDRWNQDQMDYDKRAFKRAELQHELGHEDDWQRKQNARPQVIGWTFFDVKPGQEETAKINGLKQLKSGKWALAKYNTSGATYALHTRNATKEFGPGKYWEPKNEGVAEGFGSNYAEQLAQEVFDHNPNLDDEDKVLNLGYNMAKGELGSRAQGIFRDEDFPSDFVSAYFYLQKNQEVSEVAPPGWEKTVKAMKKHKEIDNPWALAWSMKNKGYKSHKNENADPYFESLRTKVEELTKK